MSWNTDLSKLADDEPPPFHDRQLSLGRWWKEPLFLSGEKEVVKGTSIDLSKVIGHDQGYPPMTWKYMLRSLKRIDRALTELKKNPDYYLGDFKSDLTFTELDGCLFILDGKHRTTIAKYLTYFNPHKFPNGPVLHGVNLIRYRVNHTLMDQVQLVYGKLKSDKYRHLEFSWLKSNFPYHSARFKLLNKLRPNNMPLFFNEDRIMDLIETLETSESIAKSFQSAAASYLRKPLLSYL